MEHVAKHTIVEAIYAIRCKARGEFVRANGKGCWMSKGAAAASWSRDHWTVRDGKVLCRKIKFSEQDEYEIIDILEELSQTQKDLSQLTQEYHQFLGGEM